MNITDGECARAVSNKVLRNVKCGPLEYYRTEYFEAKGFVRVGGKYIAILESPDDILMLASEGDYIGVDFGRIKRIDASGFEVREVIKNPWGLYIEQRIFVGYDSKRKIIKDSPVSANHGK